MPWLPPTCQEALKQLSGHPAFTQLLPSLHAAPRAWQKYHGLLLHDINAPPPAPWVAGLSALHRLLLIRCVAASMQLPPVVHCTTQEAARSCRTGAVTGSEGACAACTTCQGENAALCILHYHVRVRCVTLIQDTVLATGGFVHLVAGK
jgi:hypothetical protein